MSEPPRELFDKIVLADILDDEIVAAKAGEKGFPLRVFLGEVAARVTDESAFAFASGLNFFFRAEMDEEARMKVGFEVSRAYYRFAREADLDGELVAKASPLLAAIMNGELLRVRLESVDHQTVFDSSLHERDAGASSESARIQRAMSFLCRVQNNNVVRAKARVIT